MKRIADLTAVMLLSACAMFSQQGQPTASHNKAGPAAIYPDASKTPGAPNPEITQDNIKTTICDKNWKGTNKWTHKPAEGTEIVRPPESVTNPIKKTSMAAYGFTAPEADYELDHLISLENGGCPDCPTNLWPQAYGDAKHPMTQEQREAWDKANPKSTAVLPGALQKDKAEGYIHDEICFGIPNAKMENEHEYPPTKAISLKRAQEILATDWYACYLNMVAKKACE